MATQEELIRLQAEYEENLKRSQEIERQAQITRNAQSAEIARLGMFDELGINSFDRQFYKNAEDQAFQNNAIYGQQRPVSQENPPVPQQFNGQLGMPVSSAGFSGNLFGQTPQPAPVEDIASNGVGLLNEIISKRRGKLSSSNPNQNFQTPMLQDQQSQNILGQDVNNAIQALGSPAAPNQLTSMDPLRPQSQMEIAAAQQKPTISSNIAEKMLSDNRFSLSSGDNGLGLGSTIKFKDTDTQVSAKQLINNQEKLSKNYGSPKHYENTFGNGEFMLALAMGFNNLRTFPNAQWGQFLQGQMQDISAQKKATNNANWFVSKGREDLAEAVFNGLPMEQALAEYNRKPDETFRELTAEEYKAMSHDPLVNGRIQVSETTGRRYGYGSKPPVTNVEIDMGGTGKYADKLGEKFAESDVELASKAVKAPQRISALNATASAITEGAVSQGKDGFLTGPLAGFRQGVDKFLVAFGDRSPIRINRLTDAELIDATLGADVFGAIGELGIGARGLDTPAEREFLRQVLTGTIETTPSALLYLAYLRQKIQSRTAEQYNSLFDSGAYGQMGAQRGMTRIEIPESIFGEGFTSFDDAKRWLANKKKEYANKNIEGAVSPGGSGSFTDDDGTEYDIERVD